MLPDIILAEEAEVSEPDPRDIFSPGFLQRRDVPLDRALEEVEPRLPRFFQQFSPVTTRQANAVTLKYTPIAISAPDGAFNEMTGIVFNRRNGPQIYSTLVQPALARMRQQ